MLIIVLFLLFISLVLMAIMGDIAKTKDELEALHQLMWRWYLQSEIEEDCEEDDV